MIAVLKKYVYFCKRKYNKRKMTTRILTPIAKRLNTPNINALINVKWWEVTSLLSIYYKSAISLYKI